MKSILCGVYHYIQYPDNACWEINKKHRCFNADPNCPQTEDTR